RGGSGRARSRHGGAPALASPLARGAGRNLQTELSNSLLLGGVRATERLAVRRVSLRAVLNFATDCYLSLTCARVTSAGERQPRWVRPSSRSARRRSSTRFSARTARGTEPSDG